MDEQRTVTYIDGGVPMGPLPKDLANAQRIDHKRIQEFKRDLFAAPGVGRRDASKGRSSAG